MNPPLFRYSIGDTDKEFSMQSVSKPFTYALCLNELGSEVSINLCLNELGISNYILK